MLFTLTSFSLTSLEFPKFVLSMAVETCILCTDILLLSETVATIISTHNTMPTSLSDSRVMRHDVNDSEARIPLYQWFPTAHGFFHAYGSTLSLSFLIISRLLYLLG